jgi:hypothetical protein
MALPTVQLLGAYRLDCTPELFAQAMEWKYGSLSLTAEEKEVAEAHVLSELADTVLIEAEIRERDDHFSVSDFGQAGSNQAAYSEVFLSQDGRAVIGDGFEIPDGPVLRIAFYLHFVDLAKELNTTYGSVPLPPLQAMPERLAQLVPYEPVT